MGNCQAVDAAALVIQHPNGKVDRMYWPITVNQVMKMNPGHYVSLIIPLSQSDNQPSVTASATAATTGDQKNTVRYTRVKLLRPTDTLELGRAYRLVTAQEVKKVLRAKRTAKAKMNEMGLAAEKSLMNQTKEREGDRMKPEKNDQVSKHEKQKLRSASMNSRSKTWRPSLQSISEAAS
uniref:Uncharacterized protein n=1 Tax=Opuntia streptacantha TaxID=393608 RepID=A0A7C9DDH0_OPUST